MRDSDLNDDAALARHVAGTARDLLVAVRESGLFEGTALGDAGDRVANAFILEALKAARPADAVLSEEEPDDPQRLASRRVWIVDPLDGTREYREGRDDWAVHVALAVAGAAAAGAVAMSGRDTLGSAPPPVLPASPGRLRMVVSRTRAPAVALAIAERLNAEVIAMGSAGAKAAAVVRGDADIYLHVGAQNEWDNCAPVAVAVAAGLHASRLDGSSPVYNHADTLVPDLLICRKEHAGQVLALAAELGGVTVR